MSDINPLLATINANLYQPLGLELSNYSTEKESEAYGACRFEIDGLKVVCRNAKITPTKAGQFVTHWKREGSGPIQPFDIQDEIDLVVINIQQDQEIGQFVFSKTVMCKHGVFSSPDHKGKRGIRVYAPWDNPTNPQALRTQKWQSKYFISVNENNSPDLSAWEMRYKHNMDH